MLTLPSTGNDCRLARRRRVAWRLITIVLGLLVSITAHADDRTGEQIYQQQCAACHGAQGEGVLEHYPHPLAGDKSREEIGRIIVETMPEDDPGACVGADAEKVTEYIYERFYSRLAQARNAPVRIALSRLTVRQYQNVVADLVGSFLPPGNWDTERGLRAEYFNAPNFRGDKRVLERRDATVQFQFGEESPQPEKIEKKEFAVRWQGGILAPDTGEYEFIVDTENGARLWVNDNQQPLIDAWVKSGSDREHRAAVRLLGGRVYPLRLEFFKSKEPTASITLKWKPPRQAVDIVPERQLSPQRFPPVLVVESAFPPDDRSVGYERGTAISKEWDQAATYAALEVIGKLAPRLSNLAGTNDDASDRTERLREFCRRFAERAFRRPLSDEERQFFVERHFDSGSNPDAAVKKILLLVLKSPRFLYREAGGVGSDSFSVAARLSFALWDSAPDQKLWEAAERGRLSTREQVAAEAERMLDDLRTRAKLREFFHQWLKVDQVTELSKDTTQFPGFDATIAADLRTSLDLFVEDILWSDTSDFRQLLLSEELYLNGRLAQLYGAELPVDAPFQKIVFEAGERAGVLSHPFLMAAFAYHATSSPIHRGVFLVRNVLGKALRPPPVAVAPLTPDLHADLTTRERVALQTSPEACQACHAMINPLGFSLERFDAVGRLRSAENGRTVDATGSYLTPAGEVVSFAGARDLAAFLVASEETHTSFVQQLFHYTVKQPLPAYGATSRGDLYSKFADQGYHMRRLLVEIATLSALTADSP